MDAEVIPADDHETGPNPVLWLALGVPLAAVCASVLTLFLAARGAEPELPAHYSWEGGALERDQVRADRAAALGATAKLDLGTSGQLRVVLAFAAAGEPLPAALDLRFTHATLPALDRHLTLALDPVSGGYFSALPPLQQGHWLVELADGGAQGPTWRLRGRFKAPALAFHLGR